MKQLKKFLIFAITTALKFFYKKKYIAGRHFNNSTKGIRWGVRGVLVQKIMGFNRKVPWPCHHTCTISNIENITFHIDDLNNFQSPGVYYQNGLAKIHLAKGCYIGPNVGLITSNHQLDNLDSHTQGKEIVINENCWIGMNSVILPGVKLGKNTIVGAGSVVTKSYLEGNIVIAGNPAKFIKKLHH